MLTTSTGEGCYLLQRGFLSVRPWFATDNLRYSSEAKTFNQGVLMFFKMGDQVQLKDGNGPSMTVIGSLHSGYLTCCWFDGQELQEMAFSNDSLTSCEVLDENAQMLQEILNLNTI